eukprot:TRINITY_DN134_c1_g1_i2.p1 TRINITY_DN134_c1_g1~~TRINITY_DN134_c1_g1_i2.p1  ORF type:complete len:216 (+),score=-13.21 TRINITY_DN134_c1_g1_i2:50-649(+)
MSQKIIHQIVKNITLNIKIVQSYNCQYYQLQNQKKVNSIKILQVPYNYDSYQSISKVTKLNYKNKKCQQSQKLTVYYYQKLQISKHLKMNLILISLQCLQNYKTQATKINVNNIKKSKRITLFFSFSYHCIGVKICSIIQDRYNTIGIRQIDIINLIRIQQRDKVEEFDFVVQLNSLLEQRRIYTKQLQIVKITNTALN